MKTHEVKSWTELFEPVLSGIKTFEVRNDDRHYSVGDQLRLREWDTNVGKYTGREITKLIVYKMDGGGPGVIPPCQGIRVGFCVLGLGDI